MKLLSKILLLRERSMKLALWAVFALIAVLWSVGISISVELTKWLAASMSRGKPGEWIASGGDWPMPAWLSMWLDPTLIESFQGQWVQVLGWLGQTGPSLDGVVSWLIPLMWVVWGAVMLIGLILALVGHFLIGKISLSNRLTNSL